jgi:hypothetical protein
MPMPAQEPLAQGPAVHASKVATAATTATSTATASLECEVRTYSGWGVLAQVERGKTARGGIDASASEHGHPFRVAWSQIDR